jgi:hypothetical protein
MKFVTYVGKEVHLGRFGVIKPGTPLVFTEKEFSDINGDPRFKTNKNPENSTETENKTVNRENQGTRVSILELNEKTKPQLLEVADALRAEGKTFELTKNPTKVELLRVLTPFFEAPVESEVPPTPVTPPAPATTPTTPATPAS